MRAPLLPALPLIEGETLSGFVSRSAQLFQTTPRDYCSDLGMHWPFLCSGHNDQIARLAWLINQPVESLSASSTQKIEIGRYKVGQAIASTGILRRTAVRLCPTCVATALTDIGPHGVYQKLEWTVLCLHRCPDHGCQLMSLPSADHSHASYDFASRILSSRREVLLASQTTQVLPETKFEVYVRRRIQLGGQDDWLADWDLTHLHRASLAMGAALQGIEAQTLRDLPKLDEHLLCEIGFERLNGGPERYTDALAELHKKSVGERPFYTADLGPIYGWLREVYQDPVLSDLVEVTCQHVFETYPTPPDKEVFGRKPSSQAWLTMEDARKRSGFGAVFLKRLLGHIHGVPEGKALERTDVHVDELDEVLVYWEKLMNLSHAASSLGILPQQVKALQNRGLLGTVRVTSSLRYLWREEVTALLCKLSELPKELGGSSTMPLKDFSQNKQVPLTRLIDLWVRGELAGKLCLGEGRGLQAIQVDCNAWCHRKEITLDRDLMLPETANYLKIGIGSIRRLRDGGYLNEVRRLNPDTNHQKSYISKSSIRRFERNYKTLGQIADQQRMAPIHLARKLDKDGVEAIPCVAGYVRVYAVHLVGRYDRKDTSKDIGGQT